MGHEDAEGANGDGGQKDDVKDGQEGLKENGHLISTEGEKNGHVELRENEDGKITGKENGHVKPADGNDNPPNGNERRELAAESLPLPKIAKDDAQIPPENGEAREM